MALWHWLEWRPWVLYYQLVAEFFSAYFIYTLVLRSIHVCKKGDDKQEEEAVWISLEKIEPFSIPKIMSFQAEAAGAANECNVMK